MKKIFMALMFGLCASAEAQDIMTREQDLASEIGRVDLKAGITVDQANYIARFYCRAYVPACDAADPAVDEGLNWRVTPRTGVEGSPIKNPIVIEKHTGTISSVGAPTLSLTKLIESKESIPKIIGVRKKIRGSVGAHPAVAKIQFVVLKSGTTSAFAFLRSSESLKCDSAARRIVEGWKFAPRKEPVTLIANVKTCSQ